MEKEDIIKLREKMSKKMNIPEEEVAEKLNLYFKLKKEHKKEMELVRSLTKSLALSLLILGRRLLEREDVDKNEIMSYYHSEIVASIILILNTTTPENRESVLRLVKEHKDS